MEHFNGLTPAEHERISLLLEEMGSAQHIIGKILRHGYDRYNPLLPATERKSNRCLLEKELGNVRFAMIFLCDEGDLSKENIHNNAKLKNIKIGKWLHHQEFSDDPPIY